MHSLSSQVVGGWGGLFNVHRSSHHPLVPPLLDCTQQTNVFQLPRPSHLLCFFLKWQKCLWRVLYRVEFEHCLGSSLAVEWCGVGSAPPCGRDCGKLRLETPRLSLTYSRKYKGKQQLVLEAGHLYFLSTISTTREPNYNFKNMGFQIILLRFFSALNHYSTKER